MTIWTFFDYVSPAGNDLIDKWVDRLSVSDRSDLETLLRILSRQKTWAANDFKWLSGKKYQGLGEIRFRSQQGTPLRLIGTKTDTPNHFVFLIGCSHRGTKYDPADALDMAVKHRKAVLNGAVVCKYGDT